MVKKKFYVTTPIYYANAGPHIGSVYTTVAADVLARWNFLQGKRVFFLTGTDEHGQKIQEIAEKNGLKPKQFVDKIVEKFKETFRVYNISNNYFIRTSDSEHGNEVKKVLQDLYKKKLIYKGMYESYYCIGCEQYLTKSDLIDNKCLIHKTEPQVIKEESYMLKLSAFQNKLLKLIEKGEYCILPLKRRNEVIAFIKQGLQDISISRKKSKVYWGIELPFDKEHTCYVWVDAFWNYLTGLQAKKVLKEFWPPDVQLMANDILRVHATIWPALLLGLGYKLPKTLFIHGYFTVNGQKMSKSLGNVIDPVYLAENYGIDSVRYFMMRNIPFGQDGDFSESALIERHNHELADKLGNLISRVSALAERYGLEKGNPIDGSKTVKLVEKYFENYEIDKALSEIFSFVDKINEYVQKQKPWETKDKKTLWQAANAIKDASILLYSFMPETAEKIAETFNFDINFDNLSKGLKVSKIQKTTILFKKIRVNSIQANETNNNLYQEKQKINKITSIEGIMGIVNFPDWQKIDLRVAKIEKVEDIEEVDELYKLTINLGNETRTIVAGLKNYYKKEELKNKKCVVFVNLAPRKMKGIESQGMLLAAVSDDKSQVVLISPEKDVKEGIKIK